MRGLLPITIAGLLLLAGCSRRDCGCAPLPDGSRRLSYGDSVFYLRSNEYSILPQSGKSGTYTAFPNNLTIDRNTGAINVTQKGTDGESQTGLWYKINFRSVDGRESDSTMVLLSGLTYVDRFYNLAQNDSIIYPIYNGDPAAILPSGNYDLTGDNKFAVDAINGQINIRECIRRGFFNTPMNTSWRVATVRYALNDRSNGTPNKIDLVVYYYRSMAQVPSNVSALMQAHQQMTLGIRSLAPIPKTFGEIDNNLPSSLSLAKPRPPCVIIVGN